MEKTDSIARKRIKYTESQITEILHKNCLDVHMYI
jgi:hypothetical protein